ncbi:unnamed protein product [Hydatigera taeniaeformis]|uniref:SRCR domain-containing protein n=1 Tax=Hydatigena taeniaeformis TaxID=6205 RepID=A0A158REX2_HYDTA|nr:unnamed protein product [Hydatigera taeniaeformis]
MGALTCLASSAMDLKRSSPPYGVPILNSHKASLFPTRLSNFNCSGRVTLGPNPPESTSVHLGYCAHTTTLPSPCRNHRRDVAIACLEPMRLDTFSTLPPATFAPVTCPYNSSEVRLTHGGRKSGRLEVKHPESGVWGTVCADGFGTNEAKAVCRMLCSSSDDLAYAHAVINAFGEKGMTKLNGGHSKKEKEMPIHLARVACPVNAQSLNDCSLGDGWGSTQGCTHALDVGVICGPEEPLTPPRMPVESNLTCEGGTARVRFKREQLGEVSPMTVHLNGSPPEGCYFNFTTIPDLEGIVEVSFPMDKCGGTYERSTSTTLAVHLSLLVNASREPSLSSLKKEGEVEVFVLPITCLVNRSDSVRSAVRAVAISQLRPLVATRPTPPTRLAFFADKHFQRRVSDNINILPHRRVFAQISLTQPEQNSKLILRNCWLSSSETISNTSIPIIANGCLVNSDIHWHPISRNAVGFSFETAYFRRASQRVNGGSILQLFVVCQTRLCQINETDPECMQNKCA